MTFEVFLSYSERDLKYVEAIVQHLEGKGVRCWAKPGSRTTQTDFGDMTEKNVH